MMDQYAGYSSAGQPSYFSNQGNFVESFAPVTPIMDSLGTGKPLPRQYQSPYDMSPGACGNRFMKYCEAEL